MASFVAYVVKDVINDMIYRIIYLIFIYFIYVDVNNAMKDGIKFYESENEVILSPGIGKDGIIPSKYLTFVYK